MHFLWSDDVTVTIHRSMKLSGAEAALYCTRLLACRWLGRFNRSAERTAFVGAASHQPRGTGISGKHRRHKNALCAARNRQPATSSNVQILSYPALGVEEARTIQRRQVELAEGAGIDQLRHGDGHTV